MNLKLVERIEEDAEGIKRYVMKYEKVEEHFTQAYFNILSRFRKLSICARDLILYLAETMDENNSVATTKRTIIKFNERLAKFNEEDQYSYQTVVDAIRDLKKVGFLIQGDNKGEAWVNPKYLFRGNEQRRIDMIRDLTVKLAERQWNQK